MVHHSEDFKNPDARLKRSYRLVLKVSLILVMLMLSILLFAFKKFESKRTVIKFPDSLIVVKDIPRTLQKETRPRPLLPSIPVASDDPDIPRELTINKTEVDMNRPLTQLIPPPAISEDEPTVPFYKLSDKPVPLEKIEPHYPEIARKANIEGMVVVEVLINTHGLVEDVRVVKSNPMLDDAAVAAARQFRFTIPKQRERPVKVWMSIPFHFRLKE